MSNVKKEVKIDIICGVLFGVWLGIAIAYFLIKGGVWIL